MNIIAFSFSLYNMCFEQNVCCTIFTFWICTHYSAIFHWENWSFTWSWAPSPPSFSPPKEFWWTPLPRPPSPPSFIPPKEFWCRPVTRKRAFYHPLTLGIKFREHNLRICFMGFYLNNSISTQEFKLFWKNQLHTWLYFAIWNKQKENI